jgi:hypothetical protein
LIQGRFGLYSENSGVFTEEVNHDIN